LSGRGLSPGHLGLDNDTAYKISRGFGAGIARTGNICGAMAGAVIVIGLKYGKAAAGDDAAKERTYALVQEFITAFRAKNGSINCTELPGMTCGILGRLHRLMHHRRLQ